MNLNCDDTVEQRRELRSRVNESSLQGAQMNLKEQWMGVGPELFVHSSHPRKTGGRLSSKLVKEKRRTNQLR